MQLQRLKDLIVHFVQDLDGVLVRKAPFHAPLQKQVQLSLQPRSFTFPIVTQELAVQ